MRARTDRPARFRRASAVAIGGALALILTGCLGTVPVDPDGTLDSATDGTLRVGLSAEPGVAEIEVGRDGPPTGPLIELMNDYAESIDAHIAWTLAGEETLVALLEQGDIDIAIGGFSDETPWTERVGATRGYSDLPGLDGRTVVWLVPAGENALLSDIELFLDSEAGS
ncbi:type 2 periplasmic-binding domain-containing protein [Microbacterium sp. GXF0217]